MRLLLSLSRPAGWFEKLSQEEQDAYLKAHPHSKMKRTAHKAEPKSAALSVGTVVVEGKRVLADGSPLPEHIKKLALPPAWTDVKINPDPSGSLLAMGKDSKGRVQAVYSDAHNARQAELKFRRVSELIKKMGEIAAQNEGVRKSGTPKQMEAADCLKLIMVTGIRPGSDEDTGAAKKAYGATTLKGEHVVATENGVELHFTGKKGVSLKIPVTDPDTAEMLKRRAGQAGKDGNLFNVNDAQLRDHTHSMDGGGFKTKDFRTALGTSTAMDLTKKQKAPKTQAEYKKAVVAIAKEVSKKLGNTPTVALQSYISPVVFAKWQMGLQK